MLACQQLCFAEQRRAKSDARRRANAFRARWHMAEQAVHAHLCAAARSHGADKERCAAGEKPRFVSAARRYARRQRYAAICRARYGCRRLFEPA